MDGVFVLVLIGWIISLIGKKNKRKAKKAAFSFPKESAAQRKATVAEKVYAELETRNVQPQVAPRAYFETAIGEGESSAEPELTEALFRGSMQVESTEGECTCEPELEHKREDLVTTSEVYAGELGREPLVDFSSRGVLQGFVMSEILARPSRCVRRR